MTDELTDDLKAEMLKQIPLAKLGEPSDIANIVTFIASEKSKYITGQTFHVNGGMIM